MSGYGFLIFASGTLDGSTYALDSDGFEDAGKTAYTPHRLLMPSPIRSVR